MQSTGLPRGPRNITYSRQLVPAPPAPSSTPLNSNEISYFNLPRDVRQIIQAYPGVASRIASTSRYGRQTTQQQILAHCNGPLTIDELVPVIEEFFLIRTGMRGYRRVIFTRLPSDETDPDWKYKSASIGLSESGNSRLLSIFVDSSVENDEMMNIYNNGRGKNIRSVLEEFFAQGITTPEPLIQYLALRNRTVCMNRDPNYALIKTLMTFRNTINTFTRLLVFSEMQIGLSDILYYYIRTSFENLIPNATHEINQLFNNHPLPMAIQLVERLLVDNLRAIE